MSGAMLVLMLVPIRVSKAVDANDVAAPGPRKFLDSQVMSIRMLSMVLSNPGSAIFNCCNVFSTNMYSITSNCSGDCLC